MKRGHKLSSRVHKMVGSLALVAVLLVTLVPPAYAVWITYKNGSLAEDTWATSSWGFKDGYSAFANHYAAAQVKAGNSYGYGWYYSQGVGSVSGGHPRDYTYSLCRWWVAHTGGSGDMTCKYDT